MQREDLKPFFLLVARLARPDQEASASVSDENFWSTSRRHGSENEVCHV